jgi:hypothetical protein
MGLGREKRDFAGLFWTTQDNAGRNKKGLQGGDFLATL